MGLRKTNTLIYIVFLSFFITLITSISYALVNSEPLSSTASQNQDIAFIDDDGNRTTAPVLNEGNAYPGWSKTSVVKIKNFGSKARYKLVIDFTYEKSDGRPALADVLRLKTIKDGIEKDYMLTELINTPIIDSTPISRGVTDDITLVLSMDESAGNEYENLSIDIQLILYTEPVEYNHDHENNHGGNDGGTTVITEPEKSPEPTFDPAIDEPLPDRSDEPETEIIPDDEIPMDSILPQTGGIPIEVHICLGAALIVIGFCLRADDKRTVRKR
jgi:hypothetical protein